MGRYRGRHGCEFSVGKPVNRDWRTQFATLARKSRDPRLRAYFNSPPVADDTPIETVPLLAMDLETTGLDAASDSIVSIGLIPFDAHRIQCRSAQNWLVRPHLPLVEDSIQFHRITHSDLKTAPTFQDRIEALLTAMTGRVMVVHCHEIERHFLSTAVHGIMGEVFTFPVIDTMILEERQHTPRRFDRLLCRLGLRTPTPVALRLDTTRSRYGLPRYRSHHALTDALATAELFQAQLQHHYTPRTAVSQFWL